MKHTSRLSALLLVLVLVLAACGGDDGASGDFDTVESGVLTVCTDAPYPPFEFQADDGTWTGFDLDLMNEISSALDLEMEVTVQPFDGIWLAPAAGTCDIVASAMTITEERAANALFSDGYFDADQSLLVREADMSTYPDLDSLAGATIAVQTGTTGEAYAEENAPEGATLQSFDEPAAMFLALESSQVDAILQDFPVNAERATQEPDKFELTATFPTGEQYGFATSQSNTDLMDAINSTLADLRSDGTYDEVFDTYFGG
jgi:polar amino acid transport system substrate-binding protein